MLWMMIIMMLLMMLMMVRQPETETLTLAVWSVGHLSAWLAS